MPIRILDATTVGRIAAGEVVERPSSVVKELVENSLDAGATAVTVEIRGGGIDYLRVTDNGCGIEPSQVRLAFENHATSKLQKAEQLDDIRTLGFRGEALPSIAAVSKIEMTTRAKNQDAGVRLNVDGGDNLRVRDIGCPEGTTLVMKDLFYNIPVRRAFLKKASYEGSLVSDAMSRLMIGNPGISMRFINNGNTVYHTYGDGKLRHTIFAVYGKSTAEQMIEVDAAEGGTRISGMIGIGDLAKSTRAHEMFFINGRSVRCALLSKALEQVCRERITIGLYPMCALSLTLPPNAIDVNVHPNKLEVRFRDEEMTQTVVENLLRTAFQGEKVLEMKKEATPPKSIERVSSVREITPEEMKRALEKPKMPPLPTAAPDMPEIKREKPVQTGMFSPSPIHAAPLPENLRDQRLRENDFSATMTLERPETAMPPLPTAAPQMPDLPAREEVQMPELPLIEDTVPEYKVLGVAFRTYIIIEVEDSLLLIDQHAAHERLQYEKYCRQLEEGTASQQLLTPIVIRLSSREMTLIQENKEMLEEAGYSVEPFGDNDIQVRAVPHVLGKAELRPIFMEMINSLTRLKSATLDVRRAEVMQMSCKSAVKGGDVLTDSEIDVLIRRLMETGAPPNCPHGRPVVKSIPKRELEKMFKRIQ